MLLINLLASLLLDVTTLAKELSSQASYLSRPAVLIIPAL